MPELTTNFAVSTVATPPSPSTSGTSVVVAAGEGARFPAAPFNATIAPEGVQATPANAEVVRVTAKSTDTLTITRAQEGSSARAVVAGDRVWAGVTVKTLTDLEAGGALASATSVGASSITLNRAAAPVASGFGFVAIDRFTTNCEIRKVVTVSGTALSGMVALTKAHSAGAEVVFFQGGSVPANWFGAKGDNSTNDEPALQWALIETARQGLWLEGENRVYKCFLPLVFPGSGKMRHLNLSATVGQMTGDPNGAFVMGSQGLIRAFTGDAGTDLITTTDGVHGMGSATPFASHHGIPVCFKGSSLPGGIAAGKVYYGYATSATEMKIASNRAYSTNGTLTSGSPVLTIASTTTVQAFTAGMVISTSSGTIPQGTTIVSVVGNTITMSANATASGAGNAIMAGDLVNITSNGSGTIYCELMSMARIYLDDVFIQGNSIANLNGLAGALQQPGYMRKLRIDNCPGTGLTCSGQQYVWENLEIIGCGTGIAFEDMSMSWFFGTNVEGPTARAVHFREKARIFFSGGNGMAHFDGWHDELATVSDSIAFDLELGLGVLIQDAHSSQNVATQKFIHAGPGYSGTYTLDNCFFSNGSPGAPTLIHDEYRGHNILVWDVSAPSNNRRYINRWEAGLVQSDSYPERHPVRMLRPGGGYLGWGGQSNGVESWQSRPGSGQTAPQSEWLDTAGTAMLGVTPTGAIDFTEQTDPAAPAANRGRLYVKDNGSGKSQLVVRFPSGAVQIIATEP